MLGTLVSSAKCRTSTCTTFWKGAKGARTRLESVAAKRNYSTSSSPVQTVASVVSNQSRLGQKVTVQGWIRSVRDQKENTFVDVNDGSCLANIQTCLSSEQAASYAFIPSYSTNFPCRDCPNTHFPPETCSLGLTTGSSVAITGKLALAPNGATELADAQVAIIGKADAVRTTTNSLLQGDTETWELRNTALSRISFRNLHQRNPRALNYHFSHFLSSHTQFNAL